MNIRYIVPLTPEEQDQVLDLTFHDTKGDSSLREAPRRRSDDAQHSLEGPCDPPNSALLHRIYDA